MSNTVKGKTTPLRSDSPVLSGEPPTPLSILESLVDAGGKYASALGGVADAIMNAVDGDGCRLGLVALDGPQLQALVEAPEIWAQWKAQFSACGTTLQIIVLSASTRGTVDEAKLIQLARMGEQDECVQIAYGGRESPCPLLELGIDVKRMDELRRQVNAVHTGAAGALSRAIELEGALQQQIDDVGNKAGKRQSRLLVAVERLVTPPHMDSGVEEALEALIEVIQCEQPRSADLWNGLRKRVKRVQDDGARGRLLEKIEAALVVDEALSKVDIRSLRQKLAVDGSWDLDTLRCLKGRYSLPKPTSTKPSLKAWCKGLSAMSSDDWEFDELLGDWHHHWKRTRAASEDEEGWVRKCQWASHVQVLAETAADAADVKVLAAWVVAMVDTLTYAMYFRLAVELVKESLDFKLLARIPRPHVKVFLDGLDRLLDECSKGLARAGKRCTEKLSQDDIGKAKETVAAVLASLGATGLDGLKDRDWWRDQIREALMKGGLELAMGIAEQACAQFPDLASEVDTLLFTHGDVREGR